VHALARRGRSRRRRRWLCGGRRARAHGARRRRRALSHARRHKMSSHNTSRARLTAQAAQQRVAALAQARRAWRARRTRDARFRCDRAHSGSHTHNARHNNAYAGAVAGVGDATTALIGILLMHTSRQNTHHHTRRTTASSVRVVDSLVLARNQLVAATLFPLRQATRDTPIARTGGASSSSSSGGGGGKSPGSVDLLMRGAGGHSPTMAMFVLLRSALLARQYMW
jgi:hypothetical protein